MAITPLPTPPSRDDPTNFSARGDAFLGALPAFATEANAMAVEINAATEIAQEAIIASQAALAAANFKGNWSNLTGALAIPASVFHDDAIWLLLNNLVNVTTSEPGVTADWQLLGSTGGGFSAVESVSGATLAEKNILYVFTASATLTLPSAPAVRDAVGVSNQSGTTTCVIARNGSNIVGVADDLVLDATGIGFTLIYSGATKGWIFV